MATTTQQSVATLIKIAVANQPTYVYNELRKRGYQNPFIPPGGELESRLYELYFSNKDDFYTILQGLPYDPTKTDSANSASLLNDLVAQYSPSSSSARLSLQGAWDFIVKTVAGHDESVTEPTVKTTTSANVGAIVGLVLVAGLAVLLVWLAFFKKSS